MTHITVEELSPAVRAELIEQTNARRRAEGRLEQRIHQLREQIVARQRAEVRLADALREVADLRRQLQWTTHGSDMAVG